MRGDNPALVVELERQWKEWAERYRVLPWERLTGMTD